MHALIAGLGLIGGSIGMALRGRGWRVSYIDPHVSLDDAVASGAAEARLEQMGDDGCVEGDFDVVVVATPVDVATALLTSLANCRIVTTVCSVMSPFAEKVTVSGHPLAGAESSGLTSARADLFAGHRWFVDRTHETVDRLIADCGAAQQVVSADEHDRAMALTSHLPQVLSTALASIIGPGLLDFAGPGLATFLRLAGSDASIWQPVIAANRQELAARSAEVQRAVERILAGDADPFHRAQSIHRALTTKR